MANTRHLACLTFDFDSVSIFLARGDTTPTPISRGEFGVVGAQRLLDLLHAHSILATWFIPGVTIQTYPDMCRKIADAGHEIAHHGFEHVPPARLSRQEEALSLIKGNKEIESVSGSNARGFRSPAWDLSNCTVELLLEQGFTYLIMTERSGDQENDRKRTRKTIQWTISSPTASTSTRPPRSSFDVF